MKKDIFIRVLLEQLLRPSKIDFMFHVPSAHSTKIFCKKKNHDNFPLFVAIKFVQFKNNMYRT